MVEGEEQIHKIMPWSLHTTFKHTHNLSINIIFDCRIQSLSLTPVP